MFEKRAETRVPITDLIARRWSGRAFDSDRRVAHETLLSLLEAARWAPSCFGDEPWRYMVWDRFQDPQHWSRAFECLAEGNRVWAKHAPLLMLATAAGTFGRDGRPNRWGAYDTGAASMSLALQATAIGLMVHQMGGFDAERIRQAFKIPESYACMAMIAVGYQLPEVRIPEDLKEREHAPRNRRPLAESFYSGEWGKPLVVD
jgi:nitroreductase